MVTLEAKNMATKPRPELITIKIEKDPLGSTAMAHVAYFKGTPLEEQLNVILVDLYGDPPPGESGFTPQKVDDLIAQRAGLEAWFIGQVI